MRDPEAAHSDHPALVPDPWYEWLTRHRQGGAAPNPTLGQDVARYRDRVLLGARLQPGVKLVDVGCGGGLVAFGAIDQIGPSLQVVFCDISAALLQRAEQTAGERGVRSQCTFLQAPAQSLPMIASGSVDVVTMRSVLVYLADKPAVAREFHRLLKPGGRVSIAEPIYRDDALRLAALGRQLQDQPKTPETRAAELFLRWKAAQLPSTPAEIDESPLTNFGEHDLVSLFEAAGFTDLHLELHIDVRPLAAESWDKILDSAPRPNTPTLRQVLESQFSAEERREFEAQLRPLAESGRTRYRDVMSYLTATKPL
jgi:arsenite methyltransferase